jgi:penicillin-binding protein 2
MNQYLNRKYVVIGLFVLISVIFLIRLFSLQVLDTSYKMSAENNVLRHVTKFPARGLVYDRNGKLLVYNQAAYDVMVVPHQLKEFDTLQMCNMLNITKEGVEKLIKKAKRYSYYKPSVFIEQLSKERYAAFQEFLHNFPGFFVQTRTLRQYPYKNAAHVLGYVGEVGQKKIKADPYYKLGDYIGISGIEKSYEEVLRGQKGVEIYLVDVHNRIKGRYKNGRFDTEAKRGGDITLSIDIELQQYAEQLMQNKIGSVVAIEPSSGELLCMVSSPIYDPELLVGRIRTKNYLKLQNDTLKPLFNRALMARRPPGSTFKTINALIGLQEGIVQVNTTYPCAGGYHVSGHSMKCHWHRSNLDLVESIQQSCNAWYAYSYRALLDNPKYGNIETAFERWRSLVTSFGFGKRLGVDFSNEVNGYVPTLSFYERFYGKGRLKSLNIISNAIGQGELLMTPIQLANQAAIIANKGYYFTPHAIKEVPGAFSEKTLPFGVQRFVEIDTAHFAPVIEGMYNAVNTEEGTAWWYRKEGLDICGKTGTAENPHGEDHSIFIAFAPKENPQIAVSVYVQNGGFGARWAAPIASLVIEKYLNGKVTRSWIEKRMLEGDLIYNLPENNKKKVRKQEVATADSTTIE